MQTLSRTITRRFFTSQESYDRLRARWSALMNLPADERPTLRAVHHLLYAALLGRDYRKGFTAPTTHIKDGAYKAWRLFRALDELERAVHYRDPSMLTELLEPFGDTVTHMMVGILVDDYMPTPRQVYQAQYDSADLLVYRTPPPPAAPMHIVVPALAVEVAHAA